MFQMQRLKITFNILLLLLIIPSCGIFISSEVKNDFTFCYQNENTGLDSLININGIYYININSVDREAIKHPYDTIYSAYKFFENGFFTINPDTSVFSINVETEKNSLFYHYYGKFGCYKLIGDTIKAQFLNPPGSMTWDRAEIWFLIINDNTLKRIYRGDGKNVDINNFQSKFKNNTCILFPIENYPLDIKKTWLIKKKWFWCNKDDLKSYRKE